MLFTSLSRSILGKKDKSTGFLITDRARHRLQSRRNFVGRVLNNFTTNIVAAFFDFNGSGRLRREINLYQGGGRRSKIRRGVGVAEQAY